MKMKVSLPTSSAEIRGRGKQFKGKLRVHVGKLRNDRFAQLKGEVEQAEGRVGMKLGRLVRKAKMRIS